MLKDPGSQQQRVGFATRTYLSPDPCGAEIARTKGYTHTYTYNMPEYYNNGW